MTVITIYVDSSKDTHSKDEGKDKLQPEKQSRSSTKHSGSRRSRYDEYMELKAKLAEFEKKNKHMSTHSRSRSRSGSQSGHSSPYDFSRSPSKGGSRSRSRSGSAVMARRTGSGDGHRKRSISPSGSAGLVRGNRSGESRRKRSGSASKGQNRGQGYDARTSSAGGVFSSMSGGVYKGTDFMHRYNSGHKYGSSSKSRFDASSARPDDMQRLGSQTEYGRRSGDYQRENEQAFNCKRFHDMEYDLPAQESYSKKMRTDERHRGAIGGESFRSSSEFGRSGQSHIKDEAREPMQMWGGSRSHTERSSSDYQEGSRRYTSVSNWPHKEYKTTGSIWDNGKQQSDNSYNIGASGTKYSVRKTLFPSFDISFKYNPYTGEKLYTEDKEDTGQKQSKEDEQAVGEDFEDVNEDQMTDDVLMQLVRKDVKKKEQTVSKKSSASVAAKVDDDKKAKDAAMAKFVSMRKLLEKDQSNEDTKRLQSQLAFIDRYVTYVHTIQFSIVLCSFHLKSDYFLRYTCI